MSDNYWYHFKAFTKDYFYYGAIYCALYTIWCLLYRGTLPILDRYDVCFHILSTIFILPIGALGRPMAQEWGKTWKF